MGVFSSFIGSISATVSSLRSARAEQAQKQSKLLQFFIERDLSVDLYMKVQEALRKEGAFRFRNSEDEVELIRGIPERFKIQLHEEMYATTLMKCHFWPDRQLQEEDWMGIFHFFCLKTPTPTWGNHIFKRVGSTTNQRSSFSFDFFVTRACEKLRRLQDRTFSCLEMIAPMPMSYRVES